MLFIKSKNNKYKTPSKMIILIEIHICQNSAYKRIRFLAICILYWQKWTAAKNAFFYLQLNRTLCTIMRDVNWVTAIHTFMTSNLSYCNTLCLWMKILALVLLLLSTTSSQFFRKFLLNTTLSSRSKVWPPNPSAGWVLAFQTRSLYINISYYDSCIHEQWNQLWNEQDQEAKVA